MDLSIWSSKGLVFGVVFFTLYTTPLSVIISSIDLTMILKFTCPPLFYFEGRQGCRFMGIYNQKYLHLSRLSFCGALFSPSDLNNICYTLQLRHWERFFSDRQCCINLYFAFCLFFPVFSSWCMYDGLYSSQLVFNEVIQ